MQKIASWNTGQFPAGLYIVTVKVTASVSAGQENITFYTLASKASVFDIVASSILSGAVSADPSATQLDFQTPVAVNATVRNTGNVPLTSSLLFEASFSGTVEYSATVSIDDLKINNIQQFSLGSFLPQHAGTYLLTLKPADSSITSDINASLYVGEHAKAVFTVMPEEAPAGNVTVKGKVHLTGFPKASSSIDPLVPVMKDAIQRGINYEQTATLAWHSINNCNGCHIQEQALYGMEASRNIVTVDGNISRIFFDALKNWQLSDGSIESDPYDKRSIGTALTLWAWTVWRNQEEARPYIIKAADYLLTQGKTGVWSGYTSPHYPNLWWNDNASFTALCMMDLAHAYRLTNDTRYLAALEKAVSVHNTWDLSSGGRTNNIMIRTHILMAFADVVDLLQNQTNITYVNQIINDMKTQIRSFQHTDGGWGKKTTDISDSLVTAQAIYALLKAGVPADDPSIVAAIEFLLNNQNPDGSWTSQNRVFNTNIGVTTWVTIALPVAYEKASGISADISLTFPNNVALNTASPDPFLQSGNTFTWHFDGVNESGKDLELGLDLADLEISEIRQVAASGFISFKNSATDETVVLPIEIPSVTGIAPIALKAAIDKPEYSSGEDVNAMITLTNISAEARDASLDVSIEDASGGLITHLASENIAQLRPAGLEGWGYRVAAQVTYQRPLRDARAASDIDFEQILTSLGLSGKTIDRNSLRVIEADAGGRILGEKQAMASFSSDVLAKVTWIMDGLTTRETTRYFYIYFDTTDHGPKEPSLRADVPERDILIGYVDYTGRIYTVKSNSNGTFEAPVFVDDISTSTDNSRGIVVDDFNRDGYPDIVTGSGSGDLYLYQNKANDSNEFYQKLTIADVLSGGFVMDMTNADFNNDGYEDFILKSGSNTGNKIILFAGKGDGTFVSSYLPTCSPYNNTYMGRSSADMDGDGDIDMIDGEYKGTVRLYTNDGSGVFTCRTVFTNPDPRTLWNEYGMAAGDFDSDGKADMIVSSSDAPYDSTLGKAWFFKGNDGTFAERVNVPSLLTNQYTAYDVGDFNKDGKLDIVAAVVGTIEFFAGNGDATFAPKVTIATTEFSTLGIGVSPALPVLTPVLGAAEAVPSAVFNLFWNTGTTYPGGYKVHAIVYDSGRIIAEKYVPFDIWADRVLNSAVVTDRISYSANQAVTLTSAMKSLSSNFIFENLAASVSIRDSHGATLYMNSIPVSILLPGQQIELKTYWNTATNPSGDYPVTLEIRDAAGALLSTSTTTLTISSDIKPSSLLKAQISVDRQSILQGEPVAISYSVTNIGNMDISQLDLSVLTVHVTALTTYDTLSDQTALLMAETYSNIRQLDTQNYSAKDYLVILRANISGVEETLGGTYFRVEGAPSVPSLNAPANAADVETFTPLLTVNNSSDPNDDRLVYEFELYTDSGLTTRIISSGEQEEGTNTTSWQVSSDLQENAAYYWRTRAYDGLLYGEWMTPAAFRVNTFNDSPTAPGISSPADFSSVDTATPVLAVSNATDPDSYNFTYNFLIAQDSELLNIVASENGIFEGQGATSWQVPVSLQENNWYYWTAQADDWLIIGPWMATARFFVNTTNDAPSAPEIITPSDGAEIAATDIGITALNSTDPDSVGITYVFEVDSSLTFDSPDKITSGSLAEGTGSTSWLAVGLRDNVWYYARAKASDGMAESPWSTVVPFFVNTANDAPTAPVLANPSNGAGINSFTPTLSVRNATDIDNDALTYEFEVYGDASLTNLVSAASYIGETPQFTAWTVAMPLTENIIYYWRARAYDGELYSPWMPVASFMVNTANDAPGAPMLNAPAMGSSLDTTDPVLSVHNASDPDSDNLTYDFEIYAQGVLIRSVTGVYQDMSGITSTALNSLTDNTDYSWRARAYDGDRYGPWMDMALFSIHLPSQNITSTIDFDPNTLNQKSKGNWVTVYIELPAGYNVRDISVSSLRLNGTIPAESWPYAIGDYDKDKIPDLMVKFNRDAVINLLPNGDNVMVTVTGTVGTTTFEGVDTIRVIH